MNNRKVYITGLGVISPLGINWDQLWTALNEKKTGIGLIKRFKRGHFSSSLAGEVDGYPIKGLHFERSLYLIKKMDRFIQYAIYAANSAFLDSDIFSSGQNSSNGSIYIGVGMGGLPNMEEGVIQQETKGARKTNPYLIPSLIPNMAGSMISIVNNLKSPQYTFAGACASGIQAIGQAREAIREGKITWALAGGSEAVNTPITFSGFEAMRALSIGNDPAKTPRPFDQDRDGMIVGEGAALFILENHESAIKRNAKIYGEVKGYSTCSSISSIVEQDREDSRECIEQALRDATLKAEDIDCVYANASGLRKGDAAEMDSLKKLFAKNKRQPAITSIKGNIGHTFGASGPLNLAAALGTLKFQAVPPVLNFKKVDLEFSGLNIIKSVNQSLVQNCLINAFGFGGINVSLIVSKVE